MDDLSHLANGSMWASGALAGGQSGNDTAQTAEGSAPAEALEPTTDVPDVADDVSADPRHLERVERARAAMLWTNVSRGPR